MKQTYKIVRFCFNDMHPENHAVILTGLTLDQAQEYCNNPLTAGEDKNAVNGSTDIIERRNNESGYEV